MATSTNQTKKIEYKRVQFDVNEIAPDAPAGEWKVMIPRGKCKVQPTREEHYPMVIVPIRLEHTEEEGEEFKKALGAELSTFLVFGGSSSQGERMSKLRIRALCEAADVDLGIIPTDLGDDPDSELEPLIRALEGKKFTAWTRLQVRKDTGETVTEVVFQNPTRSLSSGSNDDDDDNDGGGTSRSGGGRRKKAPSNKGNGKSRR